MISNAHRVLFSLANGTGVGGGGAVLDGSWVNECICASCVAVKGSISVRPSITCMHNLTYRRMCGHLCRTVSDVSGLAC